MNNISANGRAALKAVANDSAAEKLLRCKKIIVPLEQNPPNETSDRIVEDLRHILRTVQKATNASSEEVASAGDLLLRVKALGVRREKFRANKEDGEIVAGTSASQVPRPSFLSWDSLRETFTTVLGSALWRQISQGEVEISSSQRTAILEAVLDHVNSQTVLGLISELNQPNESGWSLAHSFPALVHICKEWLAARGQPQPEPVITKSFSDRLFEELNARGCNLKVGESK
jgi:hypothetical protein